MEYNTWEDYKILIINKKGFLFVGFIVMGILALIIGILTLMLIFSSNIKDTIQIIIDFLTNYGIWVLVLIFALLLNKQIIQLADMILNMLKSLLGKLGF